MTKHVSRMMHILGILGSVVQGALALRLALVQDAPQSWLH